MDEWQFKIGDWVRHAARPAERGRVYCRMSHEILTRTDRFYGVLFTDGRDESLNAENTVAAGD